MPRGMIVGVDVGGDDARPHPLYPDAVLGDLLRQPDGEGVHGGLGAELVHVAARAAITAAREET